MSRRCTFFPSAPVWWVTRFIPKIACTAFSASSRVFATLTPPPLPRPPAWICAFTTTTSVPDAFCTRGIAAMASDADSAGSPTGTGMPYFFRSCLPWYSWIFTSNLLERRDQLRDRVRRVVEQLLLVVVELELDDLLDAAGAQDARHADEQVLVAVLPVEQRGA